MLTVRARFTVWVCAAAAFLTLGRGWLKGAEDQSPPCRDKAEVKSELQVATNPAEPYQERVEAYRHAISACREDPSLYSGLAEQLLGKYQFDEALRWIQQGLKVSPDDPRLNLDLAAAFLLQTKPEQVISILKPLPPSAKGMYYMGLAYRDLGDHRAAQEALRKAWELGFHDPFLIYALIEQDRLLKDVPRFSDDMTSLRKEFPDSPWFHMAAGDALKAQHTKMAEAEAEYKEAERLNPNLAFVHHELGSIAYGRGDCPTAIIYFRQEIALNPTYPAPYVFLGVCLHREGKDAEALPYLQKGLAYAPEGPLAYLNLAVVQVDLNQLDQAVETLQEAEKKFPDISYFPGKLSGLLRRMGRLDEAKVQAALAQELGRKAVQKQQGLLFGEKTN